ESRQDRTPTSTPHASMVERSSSAVVPLAASGPKSSSPNRPATSGGTTLTQRSTIKWRRSVGGLRPQGAHRALLAGPVGEGVVAEDPHGVLVRHLVDLVVGHARQLLGHRLRRVRPRRVGVRVVALPRDVVDADGVAGLDAGLVADVAEREVVARHLARELVAELLVGP